MNWEPIETAPLDTSILLMKKFNSVNTPCIVVGEVIKFNDNLHHLWKGAYEETIDIFCQEVDPEWDQRFTHWQKI